MRRREFITLLGAAVAWPHAARAQQPAIPVIGFLHSASPDTFVDRLRAFRQGLKEAGYVDGENVAIEFRWAVGQAGRLPELAAELVRQRVAVIVTPIDTPAARAAKAATRTIPIIFSVGTDPVAMGLVASLNRPGGNATGISFQSVELVAKRLGLLRELAPQATRFIALINRNTAFADAVIKELEAGTQSLGLSVEILSAGTIEEIDAAFASLAQMPGAALLISPDPFLTARRAQVVTLATRHSLPTIHYTREFVDIGGLISYGPNLVNVCYQTGAYTGRVLRGEKPADLPVVQPTKFELILNLTAAKALGIIIPNTLLALADEVIE